MGGVRGLAVRELMASGPRGLDGFYIGAIDPPLARACVEWLVLRGQLI